MNELTEPGPAATSSAACPARPVIVYDGQCPFCLKQIERIKLRDAHGLFEYVPRQDPSLTDRFPPLAEQDFNTGMRLVQPDGRIHVGADAVYQIARQLPGWQSIAWLYRVPILHGLARLTYRWIAANRQRLGQTCDNGMCQIGDPRLQSPPKS